VVGRARIFVYYIRYINVRADIFGLIESSAVHIVIAKEILLGMKTLPAALSLWM
jgi:hypothetical protein